MANVSQHSSVVVLNDTSETAKAGDTLRINTILASTGGVATDWQYFKIDYVYGAEITLDAAPSVSTGLYYAEYGTFYSGPDMDYGVSASCLQADPDFTNNPLDHDVSASGLQNELQGLAQVNSSAGCLEVQVPRG